MSIGFLHLFSVVYLSFIVALVFGLNDHDRAGKVIKATLRRWLKLLAALVVIGIVVQILSHI